MARAECNLPSWERERLQREREEAQRLKAERNQAIVGKLGDQLGSAYIRYAYGRDNYSDERRREEAEDRQVFAEALVNALESGRHEDKVNAISALLTAVESKIEPVARQAAEADFRNAVIG